MTTENPKYASLFEQWKIKFADQLQIFSGEDNGFDGIAYHFLLRVGDALSLGIQKVSIEDSEDVADDVRDGKTQLTDEEWEAVSGYVLAALT